MATYYDCRALPMGWKRGEYVRQAGPLAGRIETFYVSPDGRKFMTKTQLARFCGDSVDMSSFDWRTGEINPLLHKKNRRSRAAYDFSKTARLDPTSVALPIRQTASIFKQPITLIKSQPDIKGTSRTASMNNNSNSSQSGAADKPQQVFWQKRLSGIRATLAPEMDVSGIDLPRPIRSFVPGISEKATMVTLASALNNSVTVLGQKTSSKADIERNPAVFLDPRQPFILPTQITDEDILKQEERVKHIRRRLEEAISEFGI